MSDRAPAPSAELAFAGVAEHARMLAAGEVSARELVELSLQRIEASEETLNAFRCVRTEGARADAAEADRRRAQGERAPLLGVPVAIKDDVDLAGEESRFGCPGSFAPRARDCESVRRLKQAGAVIVGKTNTPELGQWPFTESSAHGATRNPWSLEHTPGGSSGGAAAAVAAGLVSAAVGSDGAGSVRIPAAWTSLVGIKPQRGRISTWPEPEAFNGLTCLGPLTRTVEDAALMLDVLSGSHPGDRHRPPPPAEPYAMAAKRAPGRLRIGLSLRIPFSLAPAKLDGRVRAAVERIAEVLRGLGHEVVRDDPPYRLIGLTFMPRSMAGLSEWIGARARPHRCWTSARCTTRAWGASSEGRCWRWRRRWSARCSARWGESSNAWTWCWRRRPRSRRSGSGRSTASATGTPTRSSSAPAPTPGRGTCWAGRA